MSDSQHGPDWWQASDGRWYPPASPAAGGATRPEDVWPMTPPTAPAPAPHRGGGRTVAIVVGAILAGLVGLVVLAVLAVTFLGGSEEIDRSAKVSELGDEREEMQQAARESLEGVFTPAESDCLVDALLQRDDLTAGQILDYAEAPGSGGPVEAAYVEVMPTCLDPNATVESAGPPSPELRAGMIEGAVNAGLAEDEANCMFDALIADGWTARDLTLAGYLPERQEELTAAVEQVAGHCFAPGS